jgi:hypothetical protein
MKQFGLFVAAGTIVILAAGQAPSQNQGPPQANSQAGQAGQAASTKVTYKPPDRKAPGSRIGSSTRGTVDSDLTIEVLAPDDHIGWSTVSQPILYGYLSRPVTLPLELTIDTHELGNRHEPLLELMLNQDRPAGIFSINLHDLGVRLTPGVDYRWSVAVIINPDQRSSDLIASGLIRYVPPPPAFASAVTGLQGGALMRSYAEHGYWYDTIRAVSQGAGRQPDWRQQRADLLDQISLPGPAAWDRLAELKE